jgi:hypothetical protein
VKRGAHTSSKENTGEEGLKEFATIIAVGLFDKSWDGRAVRGMWIGRVWGHFRDFSGRGIRGGGYKRGELWIPWGVKKPGDKVGNKAREGGALTNTTMEGSLAVAIGSGGVYSEVVKGFGNPFNIA